MKYESNEEKIFCNMNPRKKCNSLIWISLLQCFLSSSKLYNQIGEHYWRVCHSLQSCHTAQKLDRREYRARYELRLAPKMDHSYNTLPHFWTFSDPPTMSAWIQCCPSAINILFFNPPSQFFFWRNKWMVPKPNLKFLGDILNPPYQFFFWRNKWMVPKPKLKLSGDILNPPYQFFFWRNKWMVPKPKLKFLEDNIDGQTMPDKAIS